MFAGMRYPDSKIKSVLKIFDSYKKLSDFVIVISYEAVKDNEKWLLCFGGYAGADSLEIVNVLADGGVKNIYFIGWAGAQRENVSIGDFNLPNKIRCLDGLTNLDNQQVEHIKPNLELLNKVKDKLSFKNKFIGTHVSVPGVIHGIDWVKNESVKYDSVDTALSVVVYFSNKLAIKSVGILIITDSPKNHKEPINIDLNFTNITRFNIVDKIVKDIVS
jgi:purine-nucleoside phosphorylase